MNILLLNRGLQYYLRKGTEYYQKFVMESFPKSLHGELAVTYRHATNVHLKPVLLKWIEKASKDVIIRKRLKKAFPSLEIGLNADIFSQMGVKHWLMPTAIKSNDWVFAQMHKQI